MKQDQKRMHKPKSSIEPLLYEIKPFFITAVGIFSLLATSESVLRVPFALILLLCAALIFKWRADRLLARR